MIRFLADEDFNGRIIRGLMLHNREIDLVRAQEVGLAGAKDDKILQWADESGRILLTHDRRTMPTQFRARIASGLHVPGILIVDDRAPIGVCIQDISLIAECSDLDEWRDQVFYLPLR